MTVAVDVAVLLCTYNGERHLHEQLRSLAAQVDVGCELWVSDDGSSDATLGLIRGQQTAGAIRSLKLLAGDGQGHAANFLGLAGRVESASDYYAFCDQDDIWDADKLTRAVSWLQTQPAIVPALYCSRTRFVDEAGRPCGQSPLFRRTPAFANALVQNIAGGNTMVFNRAALHVLQQAGQVDVTSHDWWLYQLLAGAGANIFYDPRPGLSYRQHARNVIGANTGWASRVRRYLGALGGRNRGWNDRNLRALAANPRLLTPASQRQLQLFTQLRAGSLLQRWRALRSGGFYAQTVSGNIGLYIATLLQKM
ncbi:glycosyltransferase [Seongchinamella sediminis]|uniref:Glycosyltransferase n=1 Tax=Seongchinamella sediminis TaxID=2283635 RepID=A0A3L7E534_9GAMM|nr:glycosyltransferase family 2 protein [Seongchinamella sediminis]RLQ23692.1 glycosyltransferase [Seongchinamella sediminis]